MVIRKREVRSAIWAPRERMELVATAYLKQMGLYFL